jgi:antitoxin ParD1/3/4
VATVRKTITLTDQQDDWIKAPVERGHYTNDSEYIRDLIRREQERGTETEMIRSALIEGERAENPNASMQTPSSVSSAAYVAEYRHSPVAERDLEDIWKYTRREWDPQQAELSIDLLSAAFQVLAESPRSASACDHTRQGVSPPPCRTAHDLLSCHRRDEHPRMLKSVASQATNRW